MNIELYEGNVVVHFKNESENQQFIDEIRYDGLGAYLPGYVDRRELSFELIDSILRAAEHYGVQIDNDVREYIKKRRDAEAVEYAKKREAEAAEREQQAREAEWARKCRDGCGRCGNLLCIGDDDYKCTVSGELLEVKNKPGYDGINYYLFNYKPFPSMKCPYNHNRI